MVREEFVRPAPQQERVRGGNPVCCEVGRILVEVRNLPTALQEAIVQFRFGFSLLCITLIKCQMGDHC